MVTDLDQLDIRYSRTVYPCAFLAPDPRRVTRPKPTPVYGPLPRLAKPPKDPIPKAPRVPRACQPPRPRTAPRSEVSAKLRDLKKSLGICINGRIDRQPGKNGLVHGPPIGIAGKCQHCIDVHAKSRGMSSRNKRAAERKASRLARAA